VVGRFECTVTIDRPVEEVFSVLTDPTRSPEWSKHSIRGELLTEGPPRVGSRRRTVVKGFGRGTMESVFEVTELRPLRAVALRQISASWGGSGATRYTFTPVSGGGTRVVWVWEFNPGGVWKLFEWPMIALTRRQFQADLDNLKALMEAGRLSADHPVVTTGDQS
jgi:uncharacterized protein YndB with AHSA1/START domain